MESHQSWDYPWVALRWLTRSGACEADGSCESLVKDKMWTSEQQDKHKAKFLKDPIYTSLN